MRRHAKRTPEDWPPIGLGPIVMQRQPSPEKDREAVLAWGADRIVAYTRATLDSTFLALHMELRQPITPTMYALLADILAGKVRVRPKARKKWISPDALAVFRHWHDVNRAKLKDYDAIAEEVASGRDAKAAWRLTAQIFGISTREAKKLYWSATPTEK